MKASIRKFLECTGNSPLPYDDVTQVALQQRLLKRIALKREELCELEAALIAMDWVEVLDAVLDAKVYNIQDEIDLEEAGFNIVEAGEDVCLNNELKYTYSGVEVYQNLLEFKHLNPNSLVYVDMSVSDGQCAYCLKNDMGKVMKPATHPKVVLDIHVPNKFGGVKL